MTEVFETLTEIPVRYAETDKMGIVYHGNYLIYLELARTQFLEEIGQPYSEMEAQGLVSPVLSCDLHYGMPCTYGDVVQVYTRITKLTPVRTEYSYRLYVKGDDPEKDKPRFTGSIMHCLVDAETFKPVNQKKVLPELYAAYEKVLASE